ncbi:MAG: glycoside hydrolase family 2 TIM barrel-domain containing protein [Parabacteroides sp.]|nr:glycoside hydrolase family 2 TIM barrel-domain containing protein [Parabacteroides sp.]
MNRRVRPLIEPLMMPLVWLLSLLFTACSPVGGQARERSAWNGDWKFALSDSVQDYSSPDSDDSSWRILSLPHDWSIEGDFSLDNPATPGGGALPGGTGWYRKTFTLPEADRGRVIYVDFDGIYRNSEVWINGHSLGFRPNGYVSFRYDLTPYLNYGERTNVIAVRVDNSEQPNSRWYSGSGIYRNVWLVKVNPVHVDNWGTFVHDMKISPEEATFALEVRIRNYTGREVEAEVSTFVKGAFTDRLKHHSPSGESTIHRAAKAPFTERLKHLSPTGESTQRFSIPNPKLWSPDSPSLYTAVTEVKVGGKVVDRYETTFGLRAFRWDAATGFYLNDKPLKIKGVCLHHDLGCLGAAVNTRAIERQLRILKEMGVNAIRTSHNAPAPELLDLCDRMGLLVQDESFDMWERRKSPYDYARYFAEWHERDLTDEILRDRNHPSVFMWSIGNEVLEQWSHADATDLDLQAANLILNAGHAIDPALLRDTTLSPQSLLTRHLAAIVRRLDTSRVVTAGCNEVDPANHLFRSDALDVLGFNYHERSFEPFPRNFPGKNLIVSESTSALMTRGYYEMPSDQIYIRPESWDKPFEAPEHVCSSYDNCHVPWGSTHEKTWHLVKTLPHVSGLFVWTGFDYLGEPTPYGWPSRSSFFGIVDLAGFPKDIYYMYKSEWTDEPVLHLFPHWNWKEGEPVDIWAYYNNADEVELYLNGESLGSRQKTDSTYHVSWRVPFQPGTLRAVSRLGDKEVLVKEIHTAGEPARLLLTPDRSVIQADGSDLSFVTVDVCDIDGNLVPDATPLIRFSVEGPGEIAGTDNGDPNDPNSLRKPRRQAYYGKALVVIRNKGGQGDIHLKAVAEGLPEASVTIQAE